ncbi:MAG: twitching motility protein PilT [Chthoniobacteraceae bacterium]|nr:twitching motility protein PilT [Chthoniobacteraceae bacterium]
MIYFDTAYVAKCYLNEQGSDEVRTLAKRHGRVACCIFGRLELAATFHRNFREGKITAAQRDLIFLQLQADEANHLWTWLPMTADLLLGTASRFGEFDSSTYLRAADALHLACAAENNFKEIFSNDRHLLGAAGVFGIKGQNVISTT